MRLRGLRHGGEQHGGGTGNQQRGGGKSRLHTGSVVNELGFESVHQRRHHGQCRGDADQHGGADENGVPGVRVVAARERLHRVSAGNGGGDKQAGLPGAGENLEEGFILRCAPGQFLAQPEQHVDCIVRADADGERGGERDGDIQAQAHQSEQPHVDQHGEQQRRNHQHAGRERTEHQCRDHEYHAGDLDDVQDFILDDDLGDGGRLRHAATDVDLDVGRKLLPGEHFHFVPHLDHVHGAVAVREHHHVGQLIVVIDISVEIARLAGHRVEQQILGDGGLAVGNLEVGRIVVVHRLVHALDELGERHDLADMRLRHDEGLQLVHRLQHRRILDRVGFVALDQYVDVVGAGHAFVERAVILQQLQIGIEVLLQRAFHRQAAHAKTGDHDHDAGNDEYPVAIRAGDGSRVKRREPVPEALFAFHFRFVLARRRQNSAKRRNQRHFHHQHAQDAHARKDAEYADGNNVEYHQRQKSAHRHRAGEQHDRPDFHDRVDHRLAACRARLELGQCRARIEPVVLLVIAFQHLHRMPGANGQDQDRRRHVENIQRNVGQPHEALRPLHGNQWRDQWQNQPLQGAEGFKVDQPDDHQRGQHQHWRAPGEFLEHRQEGRIAADHDVNRVVPLGIDDGLDLVGHEGEPAADFLAVGFFPVADFGQNHGGLEIVGYH